MMKPLLRSLFMIAMLLLTARAAQHGLSAPSTSGQAFLQFPAAMPSYTVTDLGTLGGVTTKGMGINEGGDIAGASQFGAYLYGFLWDGDTLTNLGDLGGQGSWAYDVNDTGQVVGGSPLGGGNNHAFLWQQSGGMQDLGTLGGPDSYAFEINASGQAVGYACCAPDTYLSHAVLWGSGGIVDLGDLDPLWPSISAAYGLNDAGHRALMDAAKAAGMKHFVYISAQRVSANHPTDFYRTKAKTEAYLQASGLSYTILRPPAFMEWHVHNLLGASILTTGKTTIYGAGNNPVNFMAGHDVARFAVLALTDPRLKNRTLDIGGPDNISKNEVVRQYEKYAGKTAKVSHVPTGVMKIMGPVLRPIQPVLSRLMSFSVWVDTTNQKFYTSAMLKEFPMTLTRVDDFVRDVLASQK